MNNRFSKIFPILISVLFFLLSGLNFAQADFNPQINYQGKLTNSSSIPVADGGNCIRFSIQTDATASSSIWTEEWKASTSYATTTSGLFSVLLGTHSSLSSVNFNQTSLYLQVNYDPGCDGTYEEVFSPRKRLGASPAAFEAGKLGGQTWSSPGAIGLTTASSGAFTTLTISASSTLGTVISGVWQGTAIADAYISSASTWNAKITTSSLSVAYGPLAYNNTTGVFSLPTSTASQNGFLTAADWQTFNNKQSQLWGLSGSNLSASSTSWNVGIGTSTPSQTLTINGGLWVGTSTVGIPTLYIASTTGRVGIGTSTPGSLLDVAGIAQLRGFATSTTGLYVDGSGNVGIGTTTPGAKLHISGTDPEIRLTDTGDSEYTRITRADTSKKAIRYNRTTKPGSVYTISNLVAQWKMNDNAANTTVAELGGLYNGVLNVNTNTKTIAGKIDTALDFNGSADFVEVTNPNIGTANTFTVCLWVYPTGGSYRNVITYGNDSANRGWRLALAGGGNATWGNALPQGVTSVATIPLNQWTFICVQIVANWWDLRIYVNAVYDNFTHGGDTIAPGSTDEFRIGKVWDADQSGSQAYFLGRIDDVRYYNKVLSAEEISKIYNNGSGTDEQGLNAASTVETDVWSSQDGVLAAEEGIQTYGHGLGRTVIDGKTIRFNIGGSEKANIDASGNLGIGVATPTARLHTLATTEQLRLGYDASNYWSGTVGATGGLTFAGTGAGGTLSLTPTAGQNVNVNLSGAGDLAVNTNQLYVDTSTGNVGIGTTTPAYKLDINGDLRVNTSSTLGNVISGVWQGTAIADAYISSAGTWNAKQNAITLASSTTGTDFTISSSSATWTFNLPSATSTTRGLLASADWTIFNDKQTALGFTPVPNTRNINTASPLSGGGALSGDLTLSLATSTASQSGYLSSADWLVFSSKQSQLWGLSGSNLFASSTSWNVGIGTTTPSYKLDVIGDLRVNTSSTLGNVISGVWTGTAIADAYISSASTWNAKVATTTPFTAGYIPYATSSSAITDSNIFQLGSNIGIGTTTPAYILHAYRSTDGIVAGFTDATGTCTINPNDTALSCSSDISLKKNISSIPNALNKVLSLRGVNYQWNKQTDNRLRFGFVAQEVEEILPEFVSTDSNGIKSINYTAFSSVLVEAIKEQQKQIEALASTLIDKVKQILADLGLILEQGIAQVQKLIAGFIQTQELEIGSVETPVGFTIYDEATKEPWCLSIKNGEWQKAKGKCGNVQEVQPQSVEPDQSSEVEPPTIDTEPPAPEPAPEPEPEPAPEPEPVQ